MVEYTLTGGWQVQKQLAYVEETTYGTVPTNPTFVNAGPIVDLTDSQETQAIKYRQIGSRDLYAMIKTGEAYSFDVTFNPLDTILLNYAINLPGIGSQNIGKSLSFIKSAIINGTEMYTIYKGCRANSIDVSITADGAVEVTASYIASDISVPSTTHGLGTVGSYGTNPTLIPWTNLSGGQDPLRIGGVTTGSVVDTPSFSCSITHNLEQVKPNGQTTVKFVEPTLRDVTFEFDTWHYDTTQITARKNLTARDLYYKLSSTAQLHFTDAYLESLSMADATGDTTPKTESYTGTAKSVVVEAPSW